MANPNIIFWIYICVYKLTEIEGGCVSDCTGISFGDYQACPPLPCNHFVTCVSGDTIPGECQPPLEWDDFYKECELNSGTCVESVTTETPALQAVEYGISIRTATFVRVDSVGNVSPPAAMTTVTAATAVECARACNRVSSCRSFDYDKTAAENNCQLAQQFTREYHLHYQTEH